MEQKSAEEKTSSALIASLPSYRFLLIIVIHLDPPDEGAPIGQYGANTAWDVFCRKPDVVFVDHSGGGVITLTPASLDSRGNVAAKSVVRRYTRCRNPYRTRSPLADASKSRAGKEIMAREGKRDDAAPILSHRY